MTTLYKPGEDPPQPGEYIERGPQGGEVPNAKQITIEPGDTPFPPTSEEGNTWERVGPPQP